VARDLRIASAGHNFYALTVSPHSAEEAPVMIEQVRATHS